uniref:Putative secreted protein n=1 Tax=Anopheles darlingi TaxID=43151 RepID=A0A2M4D8F4_ANODA
MFRISSLVARSAARQSVVFLVAISLNRSFASGHLARSARASKVIPTRVSSFTTFVPLPCMNEPSLRIWHASMYLATALTVLSSMRFASSNTFSR